VAVGNATLVGTKFVVLVGLLVGDQVLVGKTLKLPLSDEVAPWLSALVGGKV